MITKSFLHGVLCRKISYKKTGLVLPKVALFSSNVAVCTLLFVSYLVQGTEINEKRNLFNVNQQTNEQQEQQQQSSNLSKSSSFIEFEQNIFNSAAGLLLDEHADFRLNIDDPLDRNLSLLLDRDGPDMRPSRDYNDFKDISLELSKRAWKVMHDHFKVGIRNKIDASWPKINSLLKDSKVSNSCLRSIKSWMNGAKNMEAWALKMLNSWGNFPMTGIFDGTYGDGGSFDSCLNIEENNSIGHAHYCSVTFRPVMPSLKDYEIVLRREPWSLRNMFEQAHNPNDVLSRTAKSFNPPSLVDEPTKAPSNNSKVRDVFTELLEHTHYHHYVYYKLGTCWPIGCSPFDVRRVAKKVGRMNILLNGPVKCFSMNETDYEQGDDDKLTMESLNGSSIKTVSKISMKSGGKNAKKLVMSSWDENKGIFIWKPHFSLAQKVALTVLMVVTIFILAMTLIDICLNRLAPLYRMLILSIKAYPLDYLSGQPMATSFARCNPQTNHQREELNSVKKKNFKELGFLMVASDGGGPLQPEVTPSTCASALDVNEDENEHQLNVAEQEKSFFMSIVDDCSIISNIAQFFRVSESQLKNDILCLNGIRCITMFWIIMAHTMLYNDWSQFGRTRSIEVSLNSLISQPLFNGTWLVDTFFLMSGLLSAFTAFKHCKGVLSNFSAFTLLFGRWLRLTPQIFFVSMIYIVLPSFSSGPHWFPLTSEFSENCVNNWWINVLHMQAFFKKKEMCNFVTWWISVDFFYHFFAVGIIWIILLSSHKIGFLSIMSVVLSAVCVQSYRHYTLGLPPNFLCTIPQIGAMWTTMTLNFFWTPSTHSIPFFFGFYIGYLMSAKRKVIMSNLNTRRALIGWTLSITLLLVQSYSTYWWVVGKAEYTKLTSTVFFGVCSFTWSLSICWIIIACQNGYGGFVNQVLSWKVFAVLGKASYLVYLTHFQIMYFFYGNQTLFLEPSALNLAYIIIGNVFFSTVYGVLLCAVYEIPWLKTQRRLLKYI